VNNPKQNRGRHRNNARRSNPSRQNFDSNGPGVRIRGNATQVYEKYIQLARDSQSAGDRVMAENMLQHAEHYFRILNENSNGERPRLSTDEPSYDQSYSDDQQDDDNGDDSDDVDGNNGGNGNVNASGNNGSGYGNQNNAGNQGGGNQSGGQNGGGRNGPRNGPNRGRGRRPQSGGQSGGGNGDGNRGADADGNSIRGTDAQNTVNAAPIMSERSDRAESRPDEIQAEPVMRKPRAAAVESTPDPVSAPAPEPVVNAGEEAPRRGRGRPRGPACKKADAAAAGEAPAQQEFTITVD